MFDIGWSEMMVILVVALIVIGPKDLPRVARNVGRWVSKARAMAREFQGQLEELARESELDTVRKEIEKAGRTNVKRSIEKTIDPEGELEQAFDPSVDKRVADKRTPQRASKSPAKAAPGQEEGAGNGASPPASPPESGPAVAEQRSANTAPAEPGQAPDAKAKGEHERVPAETN